MMNSANQLVEHFFRHESANLIAVLTRAFGIRRLDLVEDMVQQAMLEAMHAWGSRGLPDKPAAWIHRVAKDRIVDAIRREKTHDRFLEKATSESLNEQASQIDGWLEEEQISDSLLRMIFVCCHPSLDRKSQIALTLRTLCGFGVSEIARGLLLAPETAKKRLQRSRQSLANANVALDLPASDVLAQRLDVVHDVLYLMFNEGYSTSHGTEPIRDDICEEATRLCHLLCQSTYCSPATKALLALQLFHASRLEARVDEEGAVILLEDQDRSKWDRRLIFAGHDWLQQSKTDCLSTFHLEAAVAQQHCLAPSVEATDWSGIIELYGRLLELRDSPIYKLNQAIAIAQAGDHRRALIQLESLQDRSDMKHYLVLDCALARVHELEGHVELAVDALLRALSKSDAPHEKALLEKKLARLTHGPG